jgi:hypothetical protein
MLLDIFSGIAHFGEFVFMLLAIGAAWMTGRSIAQEWKPIWNVVMSGIVLGAGLRFLHFALYEAQFLSFSRFIADSVVMIIACWVGYQFTRTNQMTQQYYWLYEKVTPLSWRAKS